jgi:toxin-antitoxin system PIN domain toxin
MRLVDVNILLYADNAEADHHLAARHWLVEALSGLEVLIVPWTNVIGYLRISTDPRIHPGANTLAEALAFIGAVLGAEGVISGDPDQHHYGRMAQLLRATGRGGNLVNDVHLAALALQYDATVVSYDNDFSRFPGVRWERPPPVAED